jgi:glucosamine--fructose-6-phosphate aminotransferase (isomerizing)
MCGIVACLTRRPATDFLLPGLERLEYRGYDSVGLTVHDETGDAVRFRSLGRLGSLSRSVSQHEGPSFTGAGIGHTRWATHGLVTEANSHPHVDCAGEVHLVHNGIIENSGQLRADLALRGHRLVTEVDSEVVAHLVEEGLAGGAELADAVDKAVSQLEGSWALAVTRRGDPLVVVTAKRSPLLVATGPDGVYAASDMAALAGWAEEVQVVEDGDLAVLSTEGATWRRADGSDTEPVRLANRVSVRAVSLAGAADFMSKEIAEQPSVVGGLVDALGGGVVDGSLWKDLGLPPLRRVQLVACGTSLNGAQLLARLLGRWGVPATLGPASELHGVVREPGSLVVALSQSGETADVLCALDEASVPAPLLALTNVATSTLARRADAVVDLAAGPEIGVAATKTFSAQVVAGSAVLLSGLVASGRLDRVSAARLVESLGELPHALAAAHALAGSAAADLAGGLADAPGFVFVGRGDGVPYAGEGALKLKELTYRWTECQPAGELKHGPIALIEQGTPVVVVDDGHLKLPGNVAEMRARAARIVDVGGPGSVLPYREGLAVEAPWGPLASVVALQHLARELALALGRDVDKPRNLAKSVTVE